MTTTIPLRAIVEKFLTQLKALNFTGDIETSLAERLISATDNSIYQVMPEAIIFPKSNSDVEKVMTLLALPEYQTVTLSTRGGGTGTNGQSLNDGIILDISRHMNQILDFDEENRIVTVQTGVVKDQLNEFLRPLGYFFAPELSTSNRATIGGMINTDASGQGSCAYGKTSQHVLEILAYPLGGQAIHSRALTDQELSDLDASPLANKLYDFLAPKKEAIHAHFPQLNRFITGYDLDHFTQDPRKNLNHLLCGSEGTLGVFTEAKLNVLPIPKETALILITYNDFIKALEDAPFLMHSDPTPTSVEVIDNIVMEIAKNDFIWATTEQYFTGIDYTQLKAIQLVEFNAETITELETKIAEFIQYTDTKPNANRLSIRPLLGKKAVTDIYGLRKRAVGLLGAAKGNRRPIPFVEDTAVPPQNLAPFIAEFRTILDNAAVKYGMFGHADAGVIHVRPALDLKLAEDRPLIREISDQVFALCQKYGGALWGEHGKGVRSEYAQTFFGDLYPLVQKVKATFDPHNQLNPGKISSADDTPLLKIDEVPLRADFNQQINSHHWAENAYNTTLYCNGNGACFNYDVNSAMCPSYKATRERIHSPKGRAELIKEWLRQKSNNIVNHQFETEVYDSLSLCLSCKSCAGECPIKVNIPASKSQFMYQYYQTHKRPLYEKLLISSESMATTTQKVSGAYNLIASSKLGKKAFDYVGLVDLPKMERHKYLAAHNLYTELSTSTLAQLAHVKNREKAVIIVPDSFFNFYDATTFNATVSLLHKLGIEIFIAPYQPSGKVAQVYGALDQFKKEAAKQHELIEKLSAFDIAIVGIEPPITLTYRDEYPAIGLETPKVELVQEWLSRYLSTQSSLPQVSSKSPLKLMSHCTEKTNATHAPKAWQSVFKAFGLELSAMKSGCCGMSGGFGHIKKNLEISKKIYSQSWAEIVETNDPTTLLATGASCRGQVKRLGDVEVVHPLVKLNELIAG